MPTYVYEVIDPTTDESTPLRRFEIEQRMSDAALRVDPATGLPVRRVISGGIGFTGLAGDDLAPCASGGCMLPKRVIEKTGGGCGHTGPCDH